MSRIWWENIQRRAHDGESPLVASVRGSRQVTFAVLATSVTLIAVFIPISFLGGQVGRLFSEFGLVMASAVVISTFVALTLCPVIASHVVHGSDIDGEAESTSRRGNFYRRLLGHAIRAPLVIIAIALAFVLGVVGIYQTLPRELAPREDRGVAFIPLTAPQGSTVHYTDAQARILESTLNSHVAKGNVETIYSIIGWGDRPYRGFIVLRLPTWDKREQSQAEIVRQMRPAAGSLLGARAAVVSPAGLGLRGSSSPLRVVIGGADFDEVKAWADKLLAFAEKNENLLNPEIDFEQNQPQLDLQLDRGRADDLGISAETIATTLQTLFASRQISTYVDRGREYPVIAQGRASDRRTPDDLGNIFLRGGGGSLVPLNALVSYEEAAASPELRRYNRLRSITLSAGIADGYTLGEALDYIERGAEQILPEVVQLGYSGQSAVFKDTAGDIFLIFGLALLIVFLVLAAQFESFIHPLVIMLSVPLAIAGAIYAMTITGLSLNVYSQIGIILLIGLMAKNGILIVEFANQLRDQGLAVREAAIEASVLRVRPIIMTVFSTILGAVPLVIASGAGAEARIAIGWVIIGGLGLSLLLTLFLTPVLYVLLAGFSQPRSAMERRLADELGGNAPQFPAPTRVGSEQE